LKGGTLRNRPRRARDLPVQEPSTPITFAFVRRIPAEAISVSACAGAQSEERLLHIPHGMITVVTGPSGSGSHRSPSTSSSPRVSGVHGNALPYARSSSDAAAPERESCRRSTAMRFEHAKSRGSTNSTVATARRSPLLRLLYANWGKFTVRSAEIAVAPMSPDRCSNPAHVAKARSRDVYARLCAPGKGTHLESLRWRRCGVKTARVDGAFVATDPPPNTGSRGALDIDLIVHFGKLSKLRRADFDRALAGARGPFGSRRTTVDRRKGTSRFDGPALSYLRDGIPSSIRVGSVHTKQGQCERGEGTG